VDFVVETSYLKGYAIEAKFNIAQINSNKYKKFNENYPQIPLSYMSWEQMNFML